MFTLMGKKTFTFYAQKLKILHSKILLIWTYADWGVNSAGFFVENIPSITVKKFDFFPDFPEVNINFHTRPSLKYILNAVTRPDSDTRNTTYQKKIIAASAFFLFFFFCLIIIQHIFSLSFNIFLQISEKNNLPTYPPAKLWVG